MTLFAKKCNHGKSTHLCDINGIEIHVGSYYSPEVASYEGGTDKDLVLNLTGSAHKPCLPDELKKYNLYSFEEIVLDSPDGGYPMVTVDFWSAIVEYARDKGFKRMFVHCAAGHGRTGTAVAAMLIADGHSVLSSVKMIRDKYCREAVETVTQVEYLGQVAVYFGRLDDSAKVRGSMEKDLLSGFFGNSNYNSSFFDNDETSLEDDLENIEVDK